MLAQTPAVAQSSSAKAPALVVAGVPVELTIRSVSPYTVRISLAALDDRGVAEILRDEPVLVGRSWPAPLFKVRSKAAAAPARIEAGSLTVTAAADPLSLRVQGLGGAVEQQIQIDVKTGAVVFSVGDKPIFGLGQGGPQYDRRGHDDPMINDHGAYRLRTHGGRLPIPWIVSPAGWAMFFHQPLASIYLSDKQGKFSPPPEKPAVPLDFFVTMAEPERIMGEYAMLTGYPSMPPLWALGYQQSHRTLKDFEEVLWVAKTLREKKLPCDTLIYLGTGWCPSGWNTGHDSFEFNTRVFSDPAAQIRRLKDLDFRILLHSTYPPPRLYGSAGDNAIEADDQSAAHYWRRHLAVFRLGIDGWWPDAAEELPVESRLARIRMYWEGPLRERPNQRPFALHRTGYAGMQRLGGWLWSGDVDSTWQTLQNHLPLALNSSISGVPFWGTDIGGFYPTPEYTAEFYVRWFQFMSFCPLFRSHGRTWYTHLPFGWNTGVLGPDEMEHTKEGHTAVRVEQLHDPTVEPICRKYLELRYRMLPYIYTAAWEAHKTGVPMIRPLWLHYGDDARMLERSGEYLWGRDILVAPVVEKGAASRRLYLPRGGWYDFWTETLIEGGREVEREVDLETTPLYVRQGAILPMGPLKQFTAEKVEGPLTLAVYSGANGEAAVYEDDGTTFDFERGAFMQLSCRWDDAQRRLTIALADGSRMLPPTPRDIEVRLAPSGERRTVTFRGGPVSVSF
jgi:alpha-glucosidase/alpha-D-xyloside xylohydrolase